MNLYLGLLLSCLIGIPLGIFFYGGLRWTIEKGVSAKRPWLIFSASFFIRVAIVVLGFLLVSQGDLKRLLLALLGFHIGRFFIHKKGEKGHAS